MFAKFATALAVGRRTAWRSAAYPSHHDETRRVAAPLGRTALVCHWTIDPASGRPICSWHADETDSSPPDAASRSRPVLVFAASGAQPGPRPATASAQAEPRPAAARPRAAMVLSS